MNGGLPWHNILSLTVCTTEENILAKAFVVTTTTSAAAMRLPSFPSVKMEKKKAYWGANKVKVVHVLDLKAYRERRGIAPPINFGIRWQ